MAVASDFSPDALLDIIRAVNTTLEPPKIADLIVERAGAWAPLPCWAVVSSDLSGRLSVLASRGVTPDMSLAVHAVAGWVMRHGEEFICTDLGRDARLSFDAATGPVAAFPLQSRGRRVGALVGLDVIRVVPGAAPAGGQGLTPAARRTVRVFTEVAAAALDNALRLKQVESLSVTDDLTQLYNSRYLNQVLRRETKRASRSGRPLSLLFIDLDGFKSVNDMHGHLLGSRTLVEAAGIIRGSARETDMAARFGGDEFAVVLPDTGGEGAFAVGERLRERVAAHHFLVAEALDIRLTVSVGVATLPDAAASAEELVQAADQAMYRVKGSGKNGIQAATAPADN
jgi:diguanylate cyclase (GGDEF)-like protein